MQTLPANEKAIFSALCYSDIFDYPLTKEEIKKYLIGNSVSSSRFTTVLENLIKKRIISFNDGYYCLVGREIIIPLRKEREEISKKKLQRAKKIAYLLSFIPTIELIGISGSLAMSNAKLSDDIDFFIITKEHMLWITRLLIIIILELKSVRRGRKLKDVSNKICVNMLLDKCNLLLPKNKQNIFSAHELLQLKNIFVRNNMYNKFIQANIWIKNYLPNAMKDINLQIQEKKGGILVSLFTWFIAPLEIAAKSLQLFFINKHKTTEFISDYLLAFHPKDVTQKVLAEYEIRLKKSNFLDAQ